MDPIVLFAMNLNLLIDSHFSDIINQVDIEAESQLVSLSLIECRRNKKRKIQQEKEDINFQRIYLVNEIERIKKLNIAYYQSKDNRTNIAINEVSIDENNNTQTDRLKRDLLKHNCYFLKKDLFVNYGLKNSLGILIIPDWYIDKNELEILK